MIYTKYKQEGKSYVCQHKKIKLYDYYKCNYCGEEIIIKENKRDQDGGEITFRGRRIALHNKCLNPMLKEFERGNYGNRF